MYMQFQIYFIIVAGVDFTPGRYNATFATGATTAIVGIPIIVGNDEDIKQFSLRLYIDGAAYQQCVFRGNVYVARVFVMTGTYVRMYNIIHTYSSKRSGKHNYNLPICHR